MATPRIQSGNSKTDPQRCAWDGTADDHTNAPHRPLFRPLYKAATLLTAALLVTALPLQAQAEEITSSPPKLHSFVVAKVDVNTLKTARRHHVMVQKYAPETIAPVAPDVSNDEIAGRWHIDGILTSRTRYVRNSAIINDRLVTVDDIIDGATVTAITPKTVTLQFQNRTITLKDSRIPDLPITRKSRYGKKVLKKGNRTNSRSVFLVRTAKPRRKNPLLLLQALAKGAKQTAM
ncbi:MAG: hypothetical protein HQL50_08840 [Magnetococcales bacterium]|nr:hypothetical protein [Magnetococcales bacterium]